MRPIDQALQIVREHPEGISTIDISKIIYGRHDAQVDRQMRSLERYGLIEHFYDYRPNKKGSIVKHSCWRPCQ